MIRPRWKGMLATLALLVAVAGVPWFLYALGGGLPTSAPSAHQVGNFLGQPITDTAILRGVSLTCWIVWALFVAALGTEALAWVRDRPGPSTTRRGFRIPGLQGTAGTLFLTAILLLPQRPAPNPSGPGGPSAAPIAAALTDFQNFRSPVRLVAQQSTTTVGRTQNVRVPYTVKQYDTPWGIAEEHLGNGLRWREITDADGNTLATGVDKWVQINGRLIDEPQARLIFPGQTLFLPTHSSTPSTSWAHPATQLGHAEVDPVKDPPAVPARLHSGNGAESRPTAVHPDPAWRSTTANPETSRHGSAAGDRSATADSDNFDPIEIVGLLGTGIIAGAALATVTRLRVTQSRARHPGRRIRLPTGKLAVTEMALRLASRDDLMAATHRGLHALMADLERESLSPPRICAVLAGDEHVEVLLDRPAEPPATWQASSDGFGWRIDLAEIPAGIGTGRDPFPCLVPIGRVPGTAIEVMINLEAAGTVAVRGDSERSAGLVRSAALAFSGLPWADSADVVLVGFGDTVPLAGPHLRYAACLEEIIEELEATPGPETSAHAIAGQLTLDVDRLDGWVPTVVLSTTVADPGCLNRLKSLCSDRIGLSAMIVGPDYESGWVLDVDSTPAFIPQLRLAVEVTPAPAGDLEAVNEIVATALDLDGVSVDDPPYDKLDCSSRPRQPSDVAVDEPQAGPVAPTTRGDRAAPVRIDVLGIVEFEQVGDFRRPRSHEAAIYLAMHPDGVSEGQLDEMIWPTRREVPASTRDPVISAVRAAFGGVERFPFAQGQGHDKIYRLSNQVGTDWTQFCALYRLGRQTKSVEPLRAALELVRGRPFGDLDAGPGYQWLHTEGHVHHMQAEIADAADLAAGMYLEAGQPIEARWAANQGLLAGPYTERLWVRLMAAADALGEAQEVERLLGEMDTRLGLDGDYGQLHPDTVAAYRLYSRQRRVTGRSVIDV